ncbi:hypothetical protein V8E36_006664 [Tilletia maclaganii]
MSAETEARGSKRPSPEREHAHHQPTAGAAADGTGAAAADAGKSGDGDSGQPHFKRKRTASGPQKRHHQHSQAPPPQTRPIGRAFAAFSGELDRFQDRRERLIKLSRDVTALSKKLIFHLHRWEHPDVELPGAGDSDGASAQPGRTVEEQALEGGRKRNARLIADAKQKLDQIVVMLKDGARAESLDEAEPERKKHRSSRPDHNADAMDTSSGGEQQEKPGDAAPAPQTLEAASDSDEQPAFLSHRYDRAFGPGLEEFIEALSFLHFLEHDSIITLEQVQSYLLDEAASPQSGAAGGNPTPVLLRITTERYILGLSDLTGELMRYATNALASPAAQKANVVPRTLNVLRTLADQFEPFSAFIWDFHRKQRVTIQSLRKIEQREWF